jgi:CPA1 family monovalent cation:H+ antiporter
VAGSVVVGPALGWIVLRVLGPVRHVPTSIILQFVSTFGVWILAEAVGLSAVLTMVTYAMTVARTAPEKIPSWLRIPAYAVWDTVVFALNILAFIFIGLQIRPILESLPAADLGRYAAVAVAVLATVIAVRFVWHMPFNAVIRWRHRRVGFNPPRPTLRPTISSGLVISWAGMRGIVSLAAALALPATFPHRGLILLIAFAVVLGTLSTQGLTLKPLLRALDLDDNDPVGQEVRAARRRALHAALASIPRHRSPIADAVRHEFTAHLGDTHATAGSGARARSEHSEMHRAALQAARQAVIAMRASDEIGDDAFHEIEEQLDWLEMAGGGPTDAS